MFFPEKITKIKSNYKVLEIGPGSLPHPRSDVYLDILEEDEEKASLQRGSAEKIELKNPVFYYDGRNFPFKDNEFDYTICSHVIEHVPLENLGLFISELQRVSPKGYIEFPAVFYELLCYPPVHLYFMNYRNNKILFLDKNKFKSNFIHKSYREMFYGNDKHVYESYQRYKDFYFIGFEWERGSLDYQIVDSFDELINEDDHSRIKEYFANMENKIGGSAKRKKSFTEKILKEIERFLTKCDWTVMHNAKSQPMK